MANRQVNQVVNPTPVRLLGLQHNHQLNRPDVPPASHLHTLLLCPRLNHQLNLVEFHPVNRADDRVNSLVLIRRRHRQLSHQVTPPRSLHRNLPKHLVVSHRLNPLEYPHANQLNSLLTTLRHNQYRSLHRDPLRSLHPYRPRNLPKYRLTSRRLNLAVFPRFNLQAIQVLCRRVNHHLYHPHNLPNNH